MQSVCASQSVCATQCLCFTEGGKENMWSLDTNMTQGEQRNQDHRCLLPSLEMSEYVEPRHQRGAGRAT